MGIPRWVAVDFDHTIVDGDKLLPGAREGMQALRDKGYYIVIHSCNGRDWIEKILNTHEIPYDRIWYEDAKPICYAYVDDRAVGFSGDWQDVIQQVDNIEQRRANIPGTRGHREHAKAEAGEE